jgi:hypothetical protein
MTHRDASGGGLTGATGDLTPDTVPDPFDPGERRETSDPEHQAEVTVAQASRAPAQQGMVGMPGSTDDDRGPTGLAEHDAGYGSEHGLSPEDPAYRMERRPVGDDPGDPEPGDHSSARTRIGGDAEAGEEERF